MTRHFGQLILFIATIPSLPAPAAVKPSLPPDRRYPASAAKPSPVFETAQPVGGQPGEIVWLDPVNWPPRDTIVLVARARGDNGFVTGAQAGFAAHGYAVTTAATPEQMAAAAERVRREARRNPGLHVIIVGHGQPGVVHLGDPFTLNPDNAAQWGQALHGVKDLFLLSCNVGRDPQMLATLALASGAHVMASDQVVYSGENHLGMTGGANVIHVSPFDPAAGPEEVDLLVHAQRNPPAWNPFGNSVAQNRRPRDARRSITATH